MNIAEEIGMLVLNRLKALKVPLDGSSLDILCAYVRAESSISVVDLSNQILPDWVYKSGEEMN